MVHPLAPLSEASAIPRVRRLSDRHIAVGERWIFSAGFNVRSDLADTGRVDVELADIARLADAGARVAVVSHQGSYRDGTARHLDFVACHLTALLGRAVRYVPGTVSDAAVRAARALRPGEVALFGNVRLHAGEEANDPRFAARLAMLGDRVAVGGFSKAHRRNASNVGVLRLLPGFAAASLLAEAERLRPWSGRDSGRYSVAVLGGTKPEKTEIGLVHLASTYDLVIPGGAVLNALLAARGHRIGASVLGGGGRRCVATAAEVMARTDRCEIHVPRRVVVAPAGAPYSPRRVVDLDDGVPPGHAVVDFLLSPWARDRLRRLAADGGRALVAGPPGMPTPAGTDSWRALGRYFSAPRVRTLLLGGDTVAELPYEGPASTGGGAALYQLAHGTVPVLDELARSAAHMSDMPA
ncbi:phosphoglycerate kinase [Streptomyces sp. NBC_00829]|uniref:phosphoglycerate kinase n=1 Tax=Streptomyces sp. NBC_00829 TaxID=2903679 RepID=UPI00386AF09F|nr:phosphoglycerate kinase [Streptomyces sp. NBC_00829]